MSKLFYRPKLATIPLLKKGSNSLASRAHIFLGLKSKLLYRETNKLGSISTSTIRESKLALQALLSGRQGVVQYNTPFIPNYLRALIGTQILGNQ
jgi:hypothetical protein